MATPFEILTGPYLNHLTRAATAPVMDPLAQALFPVSNLSDNRSSKPAVYSASASDSTIAFDLNIVPGGSFETIADSDLWSMLGIGSIISDAGPALDGSAAGKVVTDFDINSDKQAIAYVDVTARSGEQLDFFGGAYTASATGGSANIRIRNRITGRWLRGADAVWTSSDENVLMTTSTTFVTHAMTFAVESLATCITDTVKLRVYLASSGDDGWYDQISIWPATNWFSVHGHNIPPAITPMIEYSTDLAVTWSTHSEMTLRRDSFYTLTSTMETFRHWRLRFEGRPDNDTFMYLGELVVGQSVDILRNPNYGATLKWADLQTRNESDIGESFISLHNAASPQRTLQMNFLFPSTSAYEQAHKEIFRGSRGGSNLIAVVPTEMDSSVVILGRIRDSLEMTKNLPLEWTSLLEIVESPLPNAPDIAYAYDAVIEPQA